MAEEMVAKAAEEVEVATVMAAAVTGMAGEATAAGEKVAAVPEAAGKAAEASAVHSGGRVPRLQSRAGGR